MAEVADSWLKHAVLEVQEYVRLCAAASRGVITRPFYRYDFVEQLDAIGWASLTVVLLTGFFTGAVLALQSGLTLDQFGARPVVGRLVSASMIKELGPVLTGLMLTGRVGSGIAAEHFPGSSSAPTPTSKEALGGAAQSNGVLDLSAAPSF